MAGAQLTVDDRYPAITMMARTATRNNPPARLSSFTASPGVKIVAPDEIVSANGVRTRQRNAARRRRRGLSLLEWAPEHNP